MLKRNDSEESLDLALLCKIRKKGVPVKRNTLFHLLGALFVLLSFQAYSSDVLQEIKTLERNGTPGLALKILNRYQPDPFLKKKAWMKWEHKRIDLYTQQNNWDAEIERLSLLQQQLTQKLLPELPESFMVWVQEQLARAHINKKEGEQALVVLRQLIWEGNEKEIERFSLWRRMVVEAYLAQNSIDDAYTSMLRYQQDYQSEDREWNLLRAHVMLQANRAGEAVQLLASDVSHEGRVLYYLATLRSHKISPSKIYKKSSVLAKRKTTPDVMRLRLWAVAAIAAQQEENWRSAVEALSHALVLKTSAAGSSGIRDAGLFEVSGNQLWLAYLNLGKELGNKAQLLLGNDEQWMNAAEKWRKKGERQNARALMVVLARQSHDQAVRSQAHEKFADLLLKRKHGLDLLKQLYLEEGKEASSYYVESEKLPDKVRHLLIDDALSRSDISLASRLMGNKVKPPAGVDALAWEMRRARILVMGGQYQQGIEVLHKILNDFPDIENKKLDHLTQILFDLQTIGAHQEVISLFELLPVNKDNQRYREILFWMADSNKALERYEEAARQYLRSATVLDEKSMDLWAQTARYQAADVLVKGGFREDARRIYNKLLVITKEPGRRAVIQNRLQQLWLKPIEELKPVEGLKSVGKLEPVKISVQPLVE